MLIVCEKSEYHTLKAESNTQQQFQRFSIETDHQSSKKVAFRFTPSSNYRKLKHFL